MSEVEYNILLQRVSQLERKVAALESGKTTTDAAIEFERLLADATVGKDYIAYRFGCSLRAVVRKLSGTHRIKLKSRKPILAIKRDVDSAWREYNKPIPELAAEYGRKRSNVAR